MKKNKDKFNPDVEIKIKEKEQERHNVKYSLSNNIYNPITGIIPKNISCENDLIIEKVMPISQNEILAKIRQKESERKHQDESLKPIKTKIINNDPSNQNEHACGLNLRSLSNEMNDLKNKYVKPINTNYIETHDGLKKGSAESNNQTNVRNRGNNIDDLSKYLKELGIYK